jgi:hypothetical protein
MMSNPLVTPSAEQIEQGVAVVTAEDNRWRRVRSQDDLARRQRADAPARADSGAVETMMFRDGYLTEASASNVLVVKDGTIVAPPKDELILPGITYGATWEFAREAGIPFEMRPVPRKRRSPPTSFGSPPRRRKCSRSPRSTAAPSRAASRARSSAGCTRSSRRTSRVTLPAAPQATRGVRRPEATVMEEKSRVLPPAAGRHLADEQRVVAHPVLRVVPALEPRDAARDERRPGLAELEVHASKRSVCGRENRRARSTWSCAGC